MAARNQPFRWITAAQLPFHLARGPCLWGRGQIGSHHTQQALWSLVLIVKSLWTLGIIFLQDLRGERLRCTLRQLAEPSSPPPAPRQATNRLIYHTLLIGGPLSTSRYLSSQHRLCSLIVNACHRWQNNKWGRKGDFTADSSVKVKHFLNTDTLLVLIVPWIGAHHFWFKQLCDFYDVTDVFVCLFGWLCLSMFSLIPISRIPSVSRFTL